MLHRFARLLSYDDAYADLRCDFLALIANFPPTDNFINDGTAVSYIYKAMTNCYIKLNKKLVADRALVFYNVFSDEQVERIENTNGTEDDYPGILLDMFQQVLTQTEYDVFYRHYVLDISIDDIRKQDGKSRNVTNKTKIRAREKIKEIIELS
jgi:DNA-directed RNA polymerase specialized sigma24 family protein